MFAVLLCYFLCVSDCCVYLCVIAVVVVCLLFVLGVDLLEVHAQRLNGLVDVVEDLVRGDRHGLVRVVALPDIDATLDGIVHDRLLAFLEALEDDGDEEVEDDEAHRDRVGDEEDEGHRRAAPVRAPGGALEEVQTLPVELREVHGVLYIYIYIYI